MLLEKKENLILKLENIKTMKWLLNLENNADDYCYDELKRQIDEVCYHNFSHLILIHHYISIMSDNIKKSIDNLISVIDNPLVYKKRYSEYLKKFETNDDFREFETYIYMDRAVETNLELNGIKGKDFSEIEEVAIKNKQIQLILIFNILGNNYFKQEDVIDNLPRLINWIKEYNEQPIEKLTADECEIIAAHIYDFNFDEILNTLNLSPNARDYKHINKIIKNLPSKFNVSNMTQVMFRLLLLKPYVWNQCSHEDIIKSIKNIKTASL